MSKYASQRKTMQTWTVRSVLVQYLNGDRLEAAIEDLETAMRTGPQAWAFKPKDVTPQPEEHHV